MLCPQPDPMNLRTGFQKSTPLHDVNLTKLIVSLYNRVMTWVAFISHHFLIRRIHVSNSVRGEVMHEQTERCIHIWEHLFPQRGFLNKHVIKTLKLQTLGKFAHEIKATGLIVPFNGNFHINAQRINCFLGLCN